MRAKVERGQTVVRAVLLVAAVGLIGVLLYRQVSRMGGSRVAVWVSATDLRAGQNVSAGLMKQVQMLPPKGALVEHAAIEGRVLNVAKEAGQPFYVNDLAPRPVPPPLATTVPSGRLLATVKVAVLDLPTKELRTADRLDIIQAGPDGVRMIAHDAYMMGNLTTRPPAGESNRIMGVDIAPPKADKPSAGAEALVLALFPKDVFPLAEAEASGGKLKIVLHSDAEVKANSLLDPTPKKVAGRSLPAVEILKGTKREKVYAADAARKLAVAPPKTTPPAPKAVASR